MKKGIYVLIALPLMFFGILSAEAAGPSGELRIGEPTYMQESFHTVRDSNYRKFFMEPMFDPIIGVDADGKLDPTQSIAYKWEASPDLMSWTFWIRDNVKFHNGDPLTNEDVAFTLTNYLNVPWTYFNKVGLVSSIDRAETVPPNKVVLYLKKPYPILPIILSPLSGLNGFVLPKKYIGEKGDKYFATHPIGSGPYKLYDWKEKVHIKLEAQDSHWRIKVPKYKYLTFKLLPEEGTRIAALKQGEVDIIKVSHKNIKPLENAGFRLQPRKDGIIVALAKLYTDDDSPIEKWEVRAALMYAIDKKAILDSILMGVGKLVGAASGMATWQLEYKPYPITPYDPKEAKRLLAKAGYPNGFQLYLYNYPNSVLPEQMLINEAIAGYWKEIGIDVKIIEIDYAAFEPYWWRKKVPPGPVVWASAYSNRVVWGYRYGFDFWAPGAICCTPDRELTRLIDIHEQEGSIEGYIRTAHAMMDRIMSTHNKEALFVTDEIFIANKSVPQWKMGRGQYAYRYEYIGQ